ncbi:MAG: homogentisate 1,2-dioxygenase, partial [Proteobacteria bacterium]|nr:homogentisate 1,2-dioxygenase [Pseudomonadota bacterium]
ASACAQAFERGTPGLQHALAHLLGCALRTPHAPLHAILLPHFLAHQRTLGKLAALEAAVDRVDLDAYVHDLLVRAGAPVSLVAIGGTPETVRAALATRPELPGKLVLDALVGLRPPGRGGRVLLGDREAVVIGALPEATTVVLALHGRGAEAGTIARRYREIAGSDPEVAIVGLCAGEAMDRWYTIRYGEPGAGSDAGVVDALGVVERAVAALALLAPGARLVLAGFSQGACLALEYAARHGDRLAAVIAPCGARIGQPAEWAPPTGGFAGVVVLGAAHADAWIARADVEATAAWFRAAGAQVDVVDGPGARHEITPRQRLRARELILGRPEPRGVGGFGATLEAEALAGALPAHLNSPRIPPFGLYAEQLNATGFTAPRAENLRTWCYRVRPASQRRPFAPLQGARVTGTFGLPPMIELAGFAPLAIDGERDFVDGLVTLCGAGDARTRRGYAVHRYAANRSMTNRAFYSADGDLVVLPEHGALDILTELGPLHVAPGAIAILPRGIVFSVQLRDAEARGYIGEPFGRHFRLPERGPVGANGLADARHFRAPAPWFEDRLAPDFRVVAKLGGFLHEASQDHSPFDVVAWHGTYAPVVYDLAAFSPVGNTAFDHGDPSIYCVVTAPDELDLIVFPARWDPTTNTFRPPFFHRNVIAEINGIVREPGAAHGPFQPGCVFVTPPLTAHGPSGRAVERTRQGATDAPMHHHGALWFQFESPLAPSPSAWAEPLEDWAATWGSHRAYFDASGSGR